VKLVTDNYRILHGKQRVTKNNPIVCSGLFLEQTQAYTCIYIRLIASGIDKIHNCPKCLKRKTLSKPYAYIVCRQSE
jgi:hypothetical protein